MLDNEAANNDPSKSSDKESCWLLYCLTKRVAEANPLSMDTPQKLPNPYLIGIHSLYAGYISDTSEAYPENKIKKKEFNLSKFGYNMGKASCRKDTTNVKAN